jgi:hypothetical protein
MLSCGKAVTYQNRVVYPVEQGSVWQRCLARQHGGALPPPLPPKKDAAGKTPANMADGFSTTLSVV